MKNEYDDLAESEQFGVVVSKLEIHSPKIVKNVFL